MIKTIRSVYTVHESDIATWTSGKYDRTSEKEQKVYELLDLLHIEYDRVDHEPAMHMDVCEEIDKILKAATCKNLFLCNRQNRFLSVINSGRENIQNKGFICADWEFPVILWNCGLYERISGCDSRLCEHPWINE